MALSTDNCYVTLEEANAYFNNRVDNDVWVATESTKKEAALITSTRLLDDMEWAGIVASETQLLAFPRIGSYFDPRLGYIVSFDTSIPSQIKNATCELALHLLSNEGLLSSTGGVTDIEVGPIKLSEIRNPSTTPYFIKKQVKALLLNGGSRNWYRAW